MQPFKLLFIVLITVLYSCNPAPKKPATFISHTTKKRANQTAATINSVTDSNTYDSFQNSIFAKSQKQSTEISNFNFSDFTLSLKNFKVYNDDYGAGSENYNGDTSLVSTDINHIDVYPNKDTVIINEDPFNKTEYVVFNLTPTDDYKKANQFKVYYSFSGSLFKWTGGFEKSLKRKETWKGKTSYKQLALKLQKDCTGYCFMIPIQIYNGYGIKSFSRKLSLKDSTLAIDKYTIPTYIYQKKLYIFNHDSLYLRIERFVNKRITETKYLVLIDPGDTYEDY